MVTSRNWKVGVFVLRSGDLLAGQADGMDLIGESDGPPEVQQSDVPV